MPNKKKPVKSKFGSFEDQAKQVIGELGFRLIKIGIIAAGSTMLSFFVHEKTESTTANVLTNLVTVGAAAAANTRSKQ